MDVLQSKCEVTDVLDVLDLSDNSLKGDDATVSVSVLPFCSASEMTYIVSSGALNYTHLLTYHFAFILFLI